MIHVYISGGLAREALNLLDEIEVRELQLDQVTLLGLIMACRDAGEIRHSNLIYSVMKDNDLLKGSLVLGNALIDMYAKCGRIAKARAVFDSRPNKDVISWTSKIVGYAINGEGEKSITTFKQMCDEKLVPNSVTFLGGLSACDHAGLIEEGMKLYNVMTNVYHIEPKIEHFGCVIDMLARAGKIEDARMFIRKMSIKANALVWRMLLNACRVHGHINIGLNSITELTQLGAYFDSANLVISSNIYAEAGRWVDVVSRKDVMVVHRTKVAGKSSVSYLTE